MLHVAIVGSGIAGLGAALALARAGHRVTLLERDATPFPASPVEAFETWDRRGAPQVRHSHAFLARLRNLLRDRAPDVLAELLAAGAEELPISNLLRPGIDDASPRPGDDDLTLLACRRITFEWVLHRLVQREANVTLRDGCEARGLILDGELSGRPRVTGVRVRSRAGEEELHADLVADAGGRRSPLPSWLAAAGLPPLEEASEPCGVFYCSRFYRLRDGVTPPERETTIGADLGYLKYAIFHGDGRIFSITFAAAPEDKPMRALLREAPFEAAARHFPVIKRWIDPAIAEPITTVYGMDSLRNTRRSLSANGEPRVAGLVLLGDAAIHTNPLYGRGCTFALVHAWLLADALAQHAGDLLAAARELEAATEREIAPWYQLALTQDRDAAAWAAQLRGEAPPSSAAPGASGAVDPRAYFRDLLMRGLVPAMRMDAAVLRAFSRSFNLLDPPGDLMRRPDIMQRVLKIYQAREQREEPYLGPGRAEMIRILDAASAPHGEPLMRLDRPRIAPLDPAKADPETREQLAKLSAGGIGNGRVLNIFATLAHHPELMRRWLVFGNHILGKSTLPARERELAILRVGYLCKSDYEWGQHVLIARRCDISDEEIARVAAGPDAAGWSAADAAVIRAADELHADQMIGDETWAALSRSWNPQQLMDLVFTIGQYHLVAMALNTFGVQRDPGVPPLP